MPRADFERLPAAMVSDPLLADLKLLSTGTQKDYPYPFAKLGLVGTMMVDHTARDRVFPINIDIFPVDTRATGLRRLRQLVTLVLAGRTIQAAQLPDTRAWRILVALAGRGVSRVIGAPRLANFLNTSAACGGPEDSGAVGLFAWGPGQAFPSETYRHGRRLPFEDQDYSVPEGTEAILDISYSPKWRVVPPKEQQVSPHGFTAFVRADEARGQAGRTASPASNRATETQD